MAVEDTFVMVKPDGVRRGLVGDVISRFERKGLKLEHIRQLVISEAILRRPDGLHHQRTGRGNVVVGRVRRVGGPHPHGAH